MSQQETQQSSQQVINNSRALADSMDEVILMAQEHAKHERNEEARNLYLEVLKIDPEHAYANHELGIVEVSTLGVEAALPRFKQAIKVDPDQEQYWVTYFDALIALDDVQAATTALNYGVQYGLERATARVLASEHGLTLQDNEETLVRLPKLSKLEMDNVKTFQTNSYWGVLDRERFQTLMEEAVKLVQPGYHLSDNFLTWGRNLSCLEDEAFVSAWQNNITIDSDAGILWRRYILATAAYHAVQLEGDFVECGVFQGSGIKTVMDYLGGTDFPRNFWGYDTYDYNPVKDHGNEFQKEGFFESVIARFADYDQVKLVKGFIPDVFADATPEKIAYLHIDLNNAEAELHSLDHLFDRVVSGGVVILDDYEWSGIYRPQKQAEDPWFDTRGYRVMPLPTGQGMLIKR